MDADQGDASRSDVEREIARLQRELAEMSELGGAPPRRATVRRMVVATLVALSVLGVVATARAFWLPERVMETDFFDSTVRRQPTRGPVKPQRRSSPRHSAACD